MGRTLRSLGSSLVALASLGTLAAGEPRLVRGPYLQALLSDSVKVLWFTDVPASGAVRFSEADGPGVAPRVVREAAPRTRHEVELSGLRPRTTYRYEVFAGDAARAPRPGAPDSDEFQFRTAPPPGTGSFRAVAIGDSHQPGPGIDAVASLLEALAPDVDLFLHMGDFGPLRDIDELVFEKYRRLVRKTSFTAARGNRDFLSTATWYEVFSPPDLRSEEIPPAARCRPPRPWGFPPGRQVGDPESRGRVPTDEDRCVDPLVPDDLPRTIDRDARRACQPDTAPLGRFRLIPSRPPTNIDPEADAPRAGVRRKAPRRPARSGCSLQAQGQMAQRPEVASRFPVFHLSGRVA